MAPSGAAPAVRSLAYRPVNAWLPVPRALLLPTVHQLAMRLLHAVAVPGVRTVHALPGPPRAIREVPEYQLHRSVIHCRTCPLVSGILEHSRALSVHMVGQVARYRDVVNA